MGKEELRARVEHDLTLHSPKHPYIGNVMDEIRTEGKLFASLLIDRCPEGPSLDRALIDVGDAVQHAIAAVARDQDAVLIADGAMRPPGADPTDE